MAPSSDDKTVSQADFDRLTGATRDDWRKWTRRRLVSAKQKGPYSWRHVLEALVLVRMEEAAGLEMVVRCWDDVHDELFSHIHRDTLDLVIDPGTSPLSRPELKAELSTDDTTTAQLARAAREPIVVDLATAVKKARVGFEQIERRVREHADPGTGRSAARARSARVWS
jgi:hypothetical protein